MEMLMKKIWSACGYNTGIFKTACGDVARNAGAQVELSTIANYADKRNFLVGGA